MAKGVVAPMAVAKEAAAAVLEGWLVERLAEVEACSDMAWIAARQARLDADAASVAQVAMMVAEQVVLWPMQQCQRLETVARV